MYYKAREVSDMLGITIYTLNNWYRWQKEELEMGNMDSPIIPIPDRQLNVSGRPKIWTEDQVEELKNFKKTIVRGRNGKMGRITNRSSKRNKAV